MSDKFNSDGFNATGMGDVSIIEFKQKKRSPKHPTGAVAIGVIFDNFKKNKPANYQNATGFEAPKITPKTFPKTVYIRNEKGKGNMPSKGDAVSENKVSDLKNPVESKQAQVNQVNLDATVASANIPSWALGLSIAGFAAGLVYANRQGSGFWGYVGYGIVGNIIFSVPYTFYYYSNLQQNLQKK